MVVVGGRFPRHQSSVTYLGTESACMCACARASEQVLRPRFRRRRHVAGVAGLGGGRAASVRLLRASWGIVRAESEAQEGFEELLWGGLRGAARGNAEGTPPRGPGVGAAGRTRRTSFPLILGKSGLQRLGFEAPHSGLVSEFWRVPEGDSCTSCHSRAPADGSLRRPRATPAMWAAGLPVRRMLAWAEFAFSGEGGGVILLLLYIMRKLEATLPPPLGSPFLPFSVILRNLEEKGEEEKEGRRKGDRQTLTRTDGQTGRRRRAAGWTGGRAAGRAGGRTDGRADTREKGAFETERERPFDGLLLCHLLLDLTFRSCTSPPLGPFPFPY